VIVGGWILVNLARGIKRLIVGKRPAPVKFVPVSGGMICPRAGCSAENPAHAQFCRVCGEPLPARASGRARRVA
jgi:hypothetical protein